MSNLMATGGWRLKIIEQDDSKGLPKILVFIGDSLIGKGATVDSAATNAKEAITSAFSEVDFHLVERLSKAVTDNVSLSYFDKDKNRHFRTEKCPTAITLVMTWQNMERSVSFPSAKNNKICKENLKEAHKSINDFMASTRDGYFNIIDEVVASWKLFNK